MLLQKWVQDIELRKAKHENEIRTIIGNTYQFNNTVRLNIQEKELELSQRAAALRHRIQIGDIEADKMIFDLTKEKDLLDRVKAEFRLTLEKQRNEIDIQQGNDTADLDHKINSNELEIKERDFGLTKMKSELEQDLETRKVELQFRVDDNNFEITRKNFEIEKERNEIQRKNLELRFLMEKQKFELDLEKTKVLNEHEREVKKIENDFYVNKQHLFIKSQEIEYNFQLEREKILLQKEEIMNKRIELEAMKAEKTAQALLDSINATKDHTHTEKLKQIEVLYKEFELQMACIKMYTADRQVQEFALLQQQLQDRVKGLFNNGNTTSNNLLGEF